MAAPAKGKAWKKRKRIETIFEETIVESVERDE
jgi:hypothetical protein